jgi:hypothetical protein
MVTEHVQKKSSFAFGILFARRTRAALLLGHIAVYHRLQKIFPNAKYVLRPFFVPVVIQHQREPTAHDEATA